MIERNETARRNLGLDLIRAMAITLVLITHGGGAIAYWSGYRLPDLVTTCGYLGVELFFALSGFLIGGLLLDIIERDTGPRAWGRFMLRRWLRTLPLYVLWLCVLAIVFPPDANRLVQIAAYGTLTQNLLWPMPSDWFAVSWSLSVEEWFYLLFSAVLLAGVSLTGRRQATLWCVIVLFIVLPTALRWTVPDALVYGEHIRKVALFRLDAIAYGVAMVALWRRRHPLVARPLPLLAVGLVLVLGICYLGYDPPPPQGHWLRTFGLTVMPLGCALCLPASLLIQRLPGVTRAVRLVSAWSYALYLVHLSVIDAVNLHRWAWGLSAFASTVLAIVLTFGLSALLHHWFERPILARRPRQYPSEHPAPRQSTLVRLS